MSTAGGTGVGPGVMRISGRFGMRSPSGSQGGFRSQAEDRTKGPAGRFSSPSVIEARIPGRAAPPEATYRKPLPRSVLQGRLRLRHLSARAEGQTVHELLDLRPGKPAVTAEGPDYWQLAFRRPAGNGLG